MSWGVPSSQLILVGIVNCSSLRLDLYFRPLLRSLSPVEWFDIHLARNVPYIYKGIINPVRPAEKNRPER